jgi:hypothetical protein
VLGHRAQACCWHVGKQLQPVAAACWLGRCCGRWHCHEALALMARCCASSWCRRADSPGSRPGSSGGSPPRGGDSAWRLRREAAGSSPGRLLRGSSLAAGGGAAGGAGGRLARGETLAAGEVGRLARGGSLVGGEGEGARRASPLNRFNREGGGNSPLRQSADLGGGGSPSRLSALQRGLSRAAEASEGAAAAQD